MEYAIILEKSIVTFREERFNLAILTSLILCSLNAGATDR